MANDSISTWTDETQEKKSETFEETRVKDKNYFDEMYILKQDNERLRNNSKDIKLELIEAREKLQKILKILNNEHTTI